MLLKKFFRSRRAQEINLTTLIIVILGVLLLAFAILLITGVLKPAQNSVFAKLAEALGLWKTNTAP
ncbi:MAG: hypothetical protein NTX24_04480 [Candidatus Pacearchaeota archaeon]|nr:hypothetical protein [Candidatus Pacearchaeota archaeon]